MVEGPTVVGLMTSVLESGGSLDVAVRTVAEEGPPISREVFGEAVRLADTKGAPGVRQALSESLGGLRDEASGYRQSLMLCISASDSPDQSERLRILGEASDMALDAVKTMGGRYSSSLSTPCMTVFGLGIIAPIILMSILPMMGMGGLFGSAAVSEGTIMAVTLVAIPAVILAMSYGIRSSNPFLPEGGARRFPAGLLALALIPVLLIAMALLGADPEDAVLLSVTSGCIGCAVLLAGDRRRDARRRRAEKGLRDCMFEVGNSLLAGEGLERSLAAAMAARPDCAHVGVAIEREFDLCRGDAEGAISRAVSPVSREVSRTLCDIHRCSRRDPEDAGRLASAVGRQFQNVAGIRGQLELELKSMTDMMLGTAVVFAPLILGLSVSMLGPLGSVSGYEGMENAGLSLSVYVVELCALISMLTSSLGGDGSAAEAGWRFCLMAPVALLVFRVCSAIQL